MKWQKINSYTVNMSCHARINGELYTITLKIMYNGKNRTSIRGQTKYNKREIMYKGKASTRG